MTGSSTPGSDGGAELSVAIIGYGLAGSTFHRPLINATSGLRLTTVVTRNPARQAQARVETPGVEVLGSEDDLWGSRPRPDLVVVATPTGTHAAIARRAIAAGVPSVVDKPLAPTGKDAAEVARLADEAGTFLTVFHNRRWDGDFLTVRKLIAEGTLGSVFRFESRFERWKPSAQPGSWRDELPPYEGGGVLADLGSHVIDQALQLFGRPATVYAEINQVRPGTAGDDSAFVAMEHHSGVRSHLWASLVASIPSHRMRVLGSAGGYGKYGLDVQEEALRGGGDPGGPGWGREPPDRWGWLVTRDGETRLETAAGEWPAFYRGVVAALREGAPPPVEPSSAVEVLDVIDAAKISARTQAVVTFPA